MGFSIITLIEALILFVNALAILNEDRFLKPIGWGYHTNIDQDSAKDKIISFLHAIRMIMSIPLIFVNVVIIAFELLFG